MENTQNRNDVINFFKDMKPSEQKQAIDDLQRIIQKPPQQVKES